jgi:hypothetical protein
MRNACDRAAALTEAFKLWRLLLVFMGGGVAFREEAGKKVRIKKDEGRGKEEEERARRGSGKGSPFWWGSR